MAQDASGRERAVTRAISIRHVTKDLQSPNSWQRLFLLASPVTNCTSLRCEVPPMQTRFDRVSFEGQASVFSVHSTGAGVVVLFFHILPSSRTCIQEFSPCATPQRNQTQCCLHIVPTCAFHGGGEPGKEDDCLPLAGPGLEEGQDGPAPDPGKAPPNDDGGRYHA